MPKEKLYLVKNKDYSSMKFPCQFCGYYSQSETGMKLHRKSRHGITKKYNHEENPIQLLCAGCKKPKPCLCYKN